MKKMHSSLITFDPSGKVKFSFPLSDSKIVALMDLVNFTGWSQKKLNDYIYDKYEIDSVRSMTDKQYEELVDHLKKLDEVSF